jgi:hypothetical protein
VYPHIEKRVRLAINAMLIITPYGENIGRFMTQELYVALVNVFNSPYHYENLPNFVENLLEWQDDGRKCFHDLGIPEESSFFGY